LQQSCPPPIPECQEEPIEGFCCPRYECPIKSESINVADDRVDFANSQQAQTGSGAQTAVRPASNEVKGCEVQGSFYEQGTIVDKASGPCLICRCGYNEKLECEPQSCEPKFMIEKMLKFHRRK